MSWIVDYWSVLGPALGFGTAFVPAGWRKLQAGWKALRA